MGQALQPARQLEPLTQPAVALAELPDLVRGFGPVKDANRVKAETRRAMLLQQLAAPTRQVAAAE